MIVATGSDQLTLKGVRAVGNGADGISLTDSAGHKVSGSAATHNGASGFELINAPGVSIVGSSASRNSTGVLVTGESAGVSISKTVVAANLGSFGIHLAGDGVARATIQDVLATGNNGTGLFVSYGDDGSFRQVTASGNGWGITLDPDVDRASVTQSTMIGNRERGLLVCPSCDGVLVTKSTADGNRDGIVIGGTASLVRKSTADGNEERGFDAGSPANDGGGNTAHANGMADCVNVFCGGA